MKKIIEGKVYNTKTAEMIHSWDNGLGNGDFGYVDEELYRTKKGKLFISGEGGPMTGYSESCGNNSYSGGSDIRPLNRNEALEWLENHEGEEVIEKYFSDLIEEA